MKTTNKSKLIIDWLVSKGFELDRSGVPFGCSPEWVKENVTVDLDDWHVSVQVASPDQHCGWQRKIDLDLGEWTQHAAIEIIRAVWAERNDFPAA